MNGDGGEDWIVDYSKLKCDGGINQMCERRRLHACRSFCGTARHAWNLAFDETVKSYKFVKRGGKRLLQVVMAGSACDKPASATCHLTYRLYEDDIEPED